MNIIEEEQLRIENLKILKAEFKKGMINKDFKSFRRSHPKLLNVILKSMDKALHKRQSIWCVL